MAFLDLLRSIDPDIDEKLSRAVGKDTNILSQVSSGFADMFVDTSQHNFGIPTKTLKQQQELDTVLLSLVTGNGDTPMPKPIALPVASNPVAVSIPTEVAGEKEFQALKENLQAAYPDQKIDIQFDKKTGAISGTIPEASIPLTSPTFATPGFEPNKTITAFDKIKADIEAAQLAGNTNEVLNLAMNLKRIVSDQQAFNYAKFSQQANEMAGIPDLEAAIASVRKAESLDPNNPRDGRISDQRMHLLNQLGQARTIARSQVQDLLKSDTVTLQADNFASAVLEKFKLSDDALRLNELQNRNLAQQQQLQEYKDNPKVLDRIAAISFNNLSPDQKTRDTIAQQLVSGKVKIDPFLATIMRADSNDLRNELLSVDPTKKINATQKMQIQQVLLADEVKLTGDVNQAKRNIQVLNQVVDMPIEQLLGDQTLGVPAGIREPAKKDMAALEMKQRVSGAGNQEKAVEKAQLSRQIKEKILQNISISNFNADVAQWKGVIQADPIAKQVIESISKPGEKITAQQFVTSYINYGDKRSLKEKVAALRGIATSAADAMIGTSILPDPSAKSVMLLIDRMGASSMANFFGGSLTGTGLPGVFNAVGGLAVQQLIER